MTSKLVTAILAVILLISSSGTIGSFYFVSSQGQTTTEPAEIVLSGDEEASPGSVIGIEGTNFGANSRVSTYFMFAEPVDLDDGSAFILQGVDLNQNTTAGLEGNNTFFDTTGDTVNTLGNLLELSTDQGGNDTTDTPITTNISSITNRNMVVVLEDALPVNGTMSLECGGATIAQGSINAAIGAFGVSPGTYNDCSISISYGDITNAGEIDELTIASDSGEDLENSLITSQTASEEGAFESSMTVPNVEEGEYAILAVAEDGSTSIAGLSVTVPESAITESAVNASSSSSTNATEGIVNETETSTSEGEEEGVEEDENATATATATATPVQNQTQDNQTDTSEEGGGQPTVQLDETSAEPAVNASSSSTNATEGIVSQQFS
jgi:hypothetical protein